MKRKQPLTEYPDHDIEGATFIRLRAPAPVYVVVRHHLDDPGVEAVYVNREQAIKVAEKMELEGNGDRFRVIEESLRDQPGDD